jgi:hypothetical protein
MYIVCIVWLRLILFADDNECAEGMNSCPLYADCIDTDGSFNCECQEGFVPKGSAKRKCIGTYINVISHVI